MADRLPWSDFWAPASWSPVPPLDLQWARWGSCDPGAGVHGFVEDRRLEAISRGSLKGQGPGRSWAIEPDFSVLGGMPGPVVSWQVYRARYCGDRLRAAGLQVVPVLQWAGSDTWDLCAWGILSGSAVAVRAPSRDLQEVAAWISGYHALVDRVEPSHVLVFGRASRVVGAIDGVGVSWSSHSLRRVRP